MYELSPARFSKMLGGRRFEVLASSSRLCFLVPWPQTPPAEAAGERTAFRMYAYERGSLWSLAEINNQSVVCSLGGVVLFQIQLFFNSFLRVATNACVPLFFRGSGDVYGPFFVQAPSLAHALQYKQKRIYRSLSSVLWCVPIFAFLLGVN